MICYQYKNNRKYLPLGNKGTFNKFSHIFLTYVMYNKVRELIAVKVLHTSLLNTIVVAFKALPLGKLCTDASA